MIPMMNRWNKWHHKLFIEFIDLLNSFVVVGGGGGGAGDVCNAATDTGSL